MVLSLVAAQVTLTGWSGYMHEGTLILGWLEQWQMVCEPPMHSTLLVKLIAPNQGRKWIRPYNRDMYEKELHNNSNVLHQNGLMLWWTLYLYQCYSLKMTFFLSNVFGSGWFDHNFLTCVLYVQLSSFFSLLTSPPSHQHNLTKQKNCQGQQPDNSKVCFAQFLLGINKVSPAGKHLT